MQERFGNDTADEHKERETTPKPVNMPQKSAVERLRALKGRGL
jgi:hypothetical protein